MAMLRLHVRETHLSLYRNLEIPFTYEMVKIISGGKKKKKNTRKQTITQTIKHNTKSIKNVYDVIIYSMYTVAISALHFTKQYTAIKRNQLYSIILQTLLISRPNTVTRSCSITISNHSLSIDLIK